MDRAAIFVDAGYVFAAGGELCCGTRARSQLHLEAAKFNKLLCDVASACGLPVLRTYWYDGAKNGVPTNSQQSIAALPNVKLRLGRLNSQNQQKGVDALIYRDLMTLARERAIAEAFVVSGDADLREGVHAAQDQGVRVTVVGIKPAKSKSHNQSRDLLNEADVVQQLGSGELSGLITLIPQPSPQVSSNQGGATSTIEQEAFVFAQQWMSAASAGDIAALQAQRPKIPSTLDGDLLRHVEQSCGLSVRNDDKLRRRIRHSFWKEVGAPASPGETS